MLGRKFLPAAVIFSILIMISMNMPVKAGGDVQISNISMFRLDLIQGGQDPASNWYSVSGGSQILHSTDKTTGEDQFSMTDPGDIEFSEIEVVGPFVTGGTRQELLDWLNAWTEGKGVRENANLELLNTNQQVVRTINFMEVIPTAYYSPSVRAGDDSLLEDRFSFKPIRIEDESGVGSGNGGGSSDKRDSNYGSSVSRIASQRHINYSIISRELLERYSDYPDQPGNKKGEDNGLTEINGEMGGADRFITGDAFRFNIDGKEIPLISCEPGAVKFEIELVKDQQPPGNELPGDRITNRFKLNQNRRDANLEDNYEDFTVTKVHFETWRIEKYYSQGDLHLKNLFQSFATGTRKTNPSDTGSLIYLDRNNQSARRVNFFGFTPVHYESVNIDSRNAGQAAIEIMEFSVLRCEFAMG